MVYRPTEVCQANVNFVRIGSLLTSNPYLRHVGIAWNEWSASRSSRFNHHKDSEMAAWALGPVCT